MTATSPCAWFRSRSGEVGAIMAPSQEGSHVSDMIKINVVQVRELIEWARERIDACLRQEGDENSPPPAAIEARTERRTLQSVLKILGVEELQEEERD